MQTDQMQTREQLIRKWYDLWLYGDGSGIPELFAEDAVLLQAWGRQYNGSAEIAAWLDEWSTQRGNSTVEIKSMVHMGDQSVVEWHFADPDRIMANGRTLDYDGMSIMRWTPDGLIVFVKQFGCALDPEDRKRLEEVDFPKE